jgi:hypothetical protein
LPNSGKTLIASGSASAAKVVGHSYGAEAEGVARQFGKSVERELQTAEEGSLQH